MFWEGDVDVHLVGWLLYYDDLNILGKGIPLDLFFL